MDILVTGGTGFLGRHLVWRLAELGHRVCFTGRQADAASTVMQLSKSPVTWLPLDHGSVTAQASLDSAIQSVEAVVHVAALSAPWGSRAAFERANVRSTEEVIAACARGQVRRLVHISTPSLYFNYSDRFNIHEQDALPEPVNHYARTKGIAEQRVLGAPIAERVILRPRAIFGPWDNTLMPRLLRVMAQGRVPLINGGQALLDITYVDNVVAAIILALSQPLPGGAPVYNVTNGEPQSVQSLLCQMAEAFGLPLRTRRLPWWLVNNGARMLEWAARLSHGREPAVTRYGAGVLAFSQTLDISAISHELGYLPQVSVAEGLRRHAAWYRQQFPGRLLP